MIEGGLTVDQPIWLGTHGGGGGDEEDWATIADVRKCRIECAQRSSVPQREVLKVYSSGW